MNNEFNCRNAEDLRNAAFSSSPDLGCISTAGFGAILLVYSGTRFLLGDRLDTVARQDVVAAPV